MTQLSMELLFYLHSAHVTSKWSAVPAMCFTLLTLLLASFPLLSSPPSVQHIRVCDGQSVLTTALPRDT